MGPVPANFRKNSHSVSFCPQTIFRIVKRQTGNIPMDPGSFSENWPMNNLAKISPSGGLPVDPVLFLANKEVSTTITATGTRSQNNW
jgi:hypothetical protein